MIEDTVTQEELIRDGEAVGRILHDPAVQRVFSALELRYYKQWKAAATPDDQQAIWRQARALEDLREALKVIEMAGQDEVTKLEREARPRNQP